MSIENQIKQYVAENFLFSDNGYHLPDDASFLDEGIIDSTGVLELVMFVEEAFRDEQGQPLSVLDDEIVPENFDSVARLAAYIRRKEGKE